MKSPLNTSLAFAASIVAGCGAAIAISSTAAIVHKAPAARAVDRAAPVDVIRLDPVVVTVSKATFEAMRRDGTAATELARTTETGKVTRS